MSRITAALEDLDRRIAEERLFLNYEHPYDHAREFGPGNVGPYQWQVDFHNAGATYTERLLLAANRVGKALRNGTRVATPRGWRRIESFSPGDKVIAGDGSITTVTGVFPQGKKPLFRLTFDCGETIDCCAEHLWRYQPPRGRFPYRRSHGCTEKNPFWGEWRVADTSTILDEVGATPAARRRVVVPTTSPWNLPWHPVPLDPYLVGVLIGDGGLTKSVTLTSADAEIIEEVRKCLPIGVVYKKLSAKYGWAISAPGGHGHGGAPNPVRQALVALGLFGCGSETKRIPEIYRLNAPDVRLAMLQGLMDTDGHISRTGAMNFSSVSLLLAQDVQFLVHSLGGKTIIEKRQTYYTHKGDRRAGRPSYRVRIRLNICPFRLRRKAERWRPRHNTPNRILHRIEAIEAGPATCISVMHPDATFVIEHGIVTHNSRTAAAEIACHLTGMYPHWWQGRRFAKPTVVWCGSESWTASRDIIQNELLGPVGEEGTGWIPREYLIDTKKRQAGISDVIEAIRVQHKSGGYSTCTLKTYEQQRKEWQGRSCDVVWFDEEPTMEIYTEGLTRILDRKGVVLVTFTNLKGATEVVRHYIDPSPGTSIFVKSVGWDSAPHLDKKMKAELVASYPEQEIEARTKGAIMMGSGAVFPIRDESIVCDPLEIQRWWRRINGIDFGIDHPGAGAFCAHDPDADTFYVYDCYKRTGETPVYHAAAMKKHGDWIPTAWPHDGIQRDKGSGVALKNQYRQHGVHMLRDHAHYQDERQNSREAGVQEMYEFMRTGRFKVFSTLKEWFEEKRMYHRKDGVIVPKFDDILSATRYAFVMRRFARTAPAPTVTRPRISRPIVGGRRA